MRKGGGKAKGSAFERQIAKDIVKAFSEHGITQRDCWRSINSGGHIIACGDLEMSEKLIAMFPFAVECKFRKKIKWQNFLLPANGSEEQKWIIQAQEAALKVKGMFPLLVMKENFGPVYSAQAFAVKGYRKIGGLKKWKQFLTNAAKEANSRNGNPREPQRRLHASRP